MKRRVKNTLLALLGFSAVPMLTACYGVAYDGCPYKELEVNGTVTDESYNPIGGIRVSATSENIANSEVITAADGTFRITTCGSTLLTAEDIDGDQNGGNYLTAKRTISSDGDRQVVIVMEKSE